MDVQILKQKLEQLSALVRELQILLAEGTGQEVLPFSIPAPEFAPPGKVVEGIFNGQEMIGPDGQTYPVPANYASKSKLVEGDALKLIIAPQGAFVFKQIGPVTRDRLKGMLEYDEAEHSYFVTVAGHRYHVLLASVTYYKGAPGDEVVILVPRGRKCAFAAVENILKNTIADSHVYPVSKI